LPWQVSNDFRRLTQRALDAGESAAFSSLFLALSFFRSLAESQPAHLPLTQAVGQTPSTLLF